MATKRTSFTFKLADDEQARLLDHLQSGNFRKKDIPYTQIAVEADGCNVALYTSGKCVVQGKGAEDWVTFVMEPQILQRVVTGYDNVLQPEAYRPHMGIDESGKGDFFGPLVISAVYVDADLTRKLREMDVRDSKTITSDKKSLLLARDLRNLLGNRFTIVTIGPKAYNRLYSKMGNVNKMLAWGHARAIENLLDSVPDCPEAIADQFGPKRQIEQALMKKGRKIQLIQRPKAESDPAVAAASILARAGFLSELDKIARRFDLEATPKGASPKVREVAAQLVGQHGPGVLLEVGKCHFRTTDQILAEQGLSREVLGEEGAAVSRARRPDAS